MSKVHNWEDTKKIEALGVEIFKEVVKAKSKNFKYYDSNVDENTDLEGIDGFLVRENYKVQPVQLKVETYANCFIETYQKNHEGKAFWEKVGWALDENLTKANKYIFWINPMGILFAQSKAFKPEFEAIHNLRNELGLVKKKGNNPDYASEGVPVSFSRMDVWFRSVVKQFTWKELENDIQDTSALDEFLNLRKRTTDWNPIDNPLSYKAEL